MFYYLIFILSFLFTYFYLFQPSGIKNFPPGPRWLPIVGSSPQLRRLTKELGHQHLALSYLSQVYDSAVVGLKLGGQLTVAVSGHAAVKRVLTGEEFEGRPDNFFIRLRCLGTRKGITCTDGPLWQEQRTFAVKHLKSLGFGKRTMETLIQEQRADVIDKLSAQVGLEVCPNLGRWVMSVLWHLTAGTQFSDDDPSFARLLDLMHSRSKVFDMSGGILGQFPWLRYLAPEASGYNLLKTVNSQLYSFFHETIQSHRKTFCLDEPKDLIDAYLKEMELRKNDEYSNFTDDQLVMVCLDMFVAGSTTTSNTISFAILYLSRYPEIQRKVQKEIDQCLGSEHVPCLADQIRLPYLCATILEVFRTCAVAPVSGPRRTLRDTEIMGYSIPKNTMVLINNWSVHNDPEHWKNPEIFNPERFIINGQLKSNDWLIPFGLGRRRCLGELLARGCIFIFLAGILQKFDIVSSDPSPPPPPIPGITLTPPHYTVIFKHRH